MIPTKKGFCLRPLEYVRLKELLPEIGNALPELNGMVYDLNANERSDYLKFAKLYASTPSVHARVPTTTVTAKLKSSRQRHDRRVVQQCQKSSNKTPTTDVLPVPYPNF